MVGYPSRKEGLGSPWLVGIRAGYENRIPTAALRLASLAWSYCRAGDDGADHWFGCTPPVAAEDSCGPDLGPGADAGSARGAGSRSAWPRRHGRVAPLGLPGNRPDFSGPDTDDDGEHRQLRDIWAANGLRFRSRSLPSLTAVIAHLPQPAAGGRPGGSRHRRRLLRAAAGQQCPSTLAASAAQAGHHIWHHVAAGANHDAA